MGNCIGRQNDYRCSVKEGQHPQPGPQGQHQPTGCDFRLETTAAQETIKPKLACCGPSQLVSDDAYESALAAPQKGLPYQVYQSGPPLPPCEDKRLDTIKALGDVVEAPPDPEIESILRLITSIYQAPAALVALFGDKKIFVQHGEGTFQRGDFPWRWSFCAWTMSSQNDQVMVIPDTFKDARFRDNVHVRGEPGIRFYCGTPLLASNGHRLGTVCFADFKPRPDFGPAQCAILNNLSEMVARVVEKDLVLQLKKQNNKVLAGAYAQLKRAIDCFEHCVALVDVSSPGWKVLYINAAWSTLSGGMAADDVLGGTVSDAFERPGTGDSFPNSMHVEAVREGRELLIEHVTLKGAQPTNSAKKPLMLKLKPASKLGVDEGAIQIGVPSFVAAKASIEDPSLHNSYYFMIVEPMPEQHSVLKLRMGLSVNLHTHSGFLSSASHLSGQSGSWFGGVEGLEVGTLLGKGGFGSVYHGIWYGTTVAVKVIDQDLRVLEANGGCSIEALLGSELRHPHVVSTLKFVVHRPPSPPPSSHLAVTPENEAVTTAYATAEGAKEAESTTGHSNGNNGGEVAGRPSFDASCVTESSIGFSMADKTWAASDMNAQVTAITGAMDSYGGYSSDWSSITRSGYGAFGDKNFACLMSPVTTGKTPSAGVIREQQARTIILLEYCDRGCLQDAVDRGWLREEPSYASRCNLEAVLATAYEVATALLYLHGHSIVHGDLSAWNVLLTSTSAAIKPGGRPFVAKIADFGLARALDIKTKIKTRTYGTITHQPPETLMDGNLSTATDVYSFGVLMWQMITGSRPWAGMSHGQIIMAVASQTVRLQFPPDAPEELAAIATRCMSYEPQERPSMAEVVKQLDALRAKLSTASLTKSGQARA